jgi:hypothetical protein
LVVMHRASKGKTPPLAGRFTEQDVAVECAA